MTDTAKQRFIIGGLGGLAPVLALLIVADFKTLDSPDIEFLYAALGFAVRAVAMFMVGGLVAYLHESETQKFKIFEIGLGAPALIAGMITGHSLVVPPETAERATATLSAFLMIPSANAQVPGPEAGQQSPSKQSGSSAFLRGFLGVRPSNVYSVVVGTHASYDAAREQSERVNAAQLGFNASIDPPTTSHPGYVVVIGANLSKEDADKLLAQAIQSGLQESRLWIPAAQ